MLDHSPDAGGGMVVLDSIHGTRIGRESSIVISIAACSSEGRPVVAAFHSTKAAMEFSVVCGASSRAIPPWEHAGSWGILSGFLAGVGEHSHGASEINRRIDVRPGRPGSDPCSPPLLTGLRRYGTARNLACDDGWSKGPRPGGICACGLRMLDGPAGPLEAHRAGSALSAAIPMRRMACARIR